MSIIQISKIQVRTGNLIDLPQLSAGEFGWADDERRLFIGNDSNRVGDPDPNNTEILTKYSPIELSGNVTIANVENLHVGGGNNGYFLQTNGNGTLVWSAIPGGSTSNIAGSTGQIQFNTAGGFDASSDLMFDAANSTLDVNGHIKSANLTVNTNSEFSNAIFTGNLRVSNTDQNTFVVFADANSIVSIGSGQVFANRLNANQANIAGNIISNTITANLFIRAASTLLVNDGSNSNIAGNLIVGNNNVWANSDGIALTGNLTAQGYISGESVTANSITINTSANINGVNLDNSTVTAANFTANTGVFTGNGSALNALNASNLSSGTIPSARLSGSYSIDVDDATTAGTVTTNAQPNITSVGTLTSANINGAVTVTGIGGLQLQGAANTTPTLSGIYSGTVGGAPITVMYSNSASANNKAWDTFVDGGGIMYGRLRSDDGVTSNNWLRVTRDGLTPNTITLFTNTSVTGNVSANAFSGDGSGLSNIRVSPVSSSSDSVHFLLLANSIGVQNLKYASSFYANPSTGVLTVPSLEIANSAVFNRQFILNTSVTEKFNPIIGSATTTLDLITGGVFDITLNQNTTVNFTNVSTANNYITGVTVFVTQGTTPYSISGVRINSGSTLTIKWQGAIVPTGDASSTNVFAFSIVRKNGVYDVYGQTISFK